MPRSKWMFALLALVLSGCEENSEIIGTVRNIEDASPIPDVAVGFGQDIDDDFTVRPAFTAATDVMGNYMLTTEFGPFPEGYVFFWHEEYYPDTVEFYGASLGRRVRVDINLLLLGDTTSTDTSAGISGR